MRPRLVLFGAGNIGRSFIGQIFARGGYEVVFVDIDARLVRELNRRGRYEVIIAHPDGRESTLPVEGVRAVDANDREAVEHELVDASIAATAVGAAALSPVAGLIRAGVERRRRERPGSPLDVILAENVHDAAAIVERTLAGGSDGAANRSTVGLVETSIGKMVPIVPPEIAARDPLLVYAEPYNTLIVDARGFRGSVPQLHDLHPVDDIRAYVDRKLYLHNLGHAAVAYEGFRYAPGISLIAEAVELAPVRSATHAAMTESLAALAAAHPGAFDRTALEENRDDLLARFANRALGDTLYRVGRDLPRKLGRDDRVVGAMRLAAAHDLPFDAIAGVYRAALGFAATDPTGEPYPADLTVVELAREHGPAAVLRQVSGLDDSDAVDARVAERVLARR